MVCIKPKPKTGCTQLSLPIPEMHNIKALRDAGKEKFQTTHDAPFPGIRFMGSKRNRAVISLLGMKKISRFVGQTLKSLRPSECHDHHTQVKFPFACFLWEFR